LKQSAIRVYTAHAATTVLDWFNLPRVTAVVRSTYFPRKDIHKRTWRIPNQGSPNPSTNGKSITNPAANTHTAGAGRNVKREQVIANQIDHVLIAERFFTSITNIRSCRTTAHTSDHFLVRVDYKCRLPEIKLMNSK
jgi:hypothetical protein